MRFKSVGSNFSFLLSAGKLYDVDMYRLLLG